MEILFILNNIKLELSQKKKNFITNKFKFYKKIYFEFYLIILIKFISYFYFIHFIIITFRIKPYLLIYKNDNKCLNKNL